jgi:hypothetical protein
MRQKALLAGSVWAFALAFDFSVGANAAVFGIGGTADFQYYSNGGAYDTGGSPATIATPGSTMFFNSFMVMMPDNPIPYTYFFDYFTVALSDNQIVYTYLSQTNWSPSITSLDSDGLYIDNGSLISSVSGIPAFTSVRLDPSSLLGTSGFTSADVTWNSGNVAVTWMNMSFAAGNTVVLDVNAIPEPLNVNAIPEPATWAMIILGFVGTVFVARRRTSLRPTVNVVAASSTAGLQATPILTQYPRSGGGSRGGLRMHIPWSKHVQVSSK